MKILDATCCYRGIWFNKHQKDTIYIDIRPEVKPDVIMDCTKTTFENKTFDLIVFDPPHQGFTKEAKGIFAKRYGSLRAEEIRTFIINAFKEFNRILKDEGFIAFKWNDHDQKLINILKLQNEFEPLFGQVTSMRTKHKSQTYWVLLKKVNI